MAEGARDVNRGSQGDDRRDIEGWREQSPSTQLKPKVRLCRGSELATDAVCGALQRHDAAEEVRSEKGRGKDDGRAWHTRSTRPQALKKCVEDPMRGESAVSNQVDDPSETEAREGHRAAHIDRASDGGACERSHQRHDERRYHETRPVSGHEGPPLSSRPSVTCKEPGDCLSYYLRAPRLPPLPPARQAQPCHRGAEEEER